MTSAIADIPAQVAEACLLCGELIQGHGFFGTLKELDGHYSKCFPSRPEIHQIVAATAKDGEVLPPDAVAALTQKTIEVARNRALAEFEEKKPIIFAKFQEHQAELEAAATAAKDAVERAAMLRIAESQEKQKEIAAFKELEATKREGDRIPELIEVLKALPVELAKAMSIEFAKALRSALADVNIGPIIVKLPDPKPIKIEVERKYQGNNLISGAVAK